MPRQRFLLTGTYQLPYGPGRTWQSKNRFVNGALGGWNINTVTLIQTGPFLTPTISPTEDQSNTGIIGRGGITARPDAVGNPERPESAAISVEHQCVCANASRRGKNRKRGRGYPGRSWNDRGVGGIVEDLSSPGAPSIPV